MDNGEIKTIMHRFVQDRCIVRVSFRLDDDDWYIFEKSKEWELLLQYLEEVQKRRNQK